MNENMQHPKRLCKPLPTLLIIRYKGLSIYLMYLIVCLYAVSNKPLTESVLSVCLWQETQSVEGHPLLTIAYFPLRGRLFHTTSKPLLKISHRKSKPTEAMKSRLISKALHLLVVVVALVDPAIAAPAPLDVVQARDTEDWTGKYEKEHPGTKVGPIVGYKEFEPKFSDIDYDGRFPIIGVPRDQMREIKLDCGGRCPGFSELRIVDMSKPAPRHTCVRDALSALAQWRMFCDIPSPSARPICWTRAPSIDRCCGEWVEEGEVSPYSSSGPMIKRHKEHIGSLDYWVWAPVTKMGKNWQKKTVKMRRVIRPSWEDYSSVDKICKLWRPRNEVEYSYFVNHLPAWNLFDADVNGKVLGLDFDWWEPEGLGRKYSRSSEWKRDALLHAALEIEDTVNGNSTMESS